MLCAVPCRRHGHAHADADRYPITRPTPRQHTRTDASTDVSTNTGTDTGTDVSTTHGHASADASANPSARVRSNSDPRRLTRPADCLFPRFRYNRSEIGLSRCSELDHTAWKAHTYIYSGGL